MPLLSLDAQCFADQGTRSCYHDYRVCAQLFCYDKQLTRCYAYRPAVEGSTCGHGRSCQGGKCVQTRSIYQSAQSTPSQYSYPVKLSKTLTRTVGKYSTQRTSVYKSQKSKRVHSTPVTKRPQQAVSSQCRDSSRRQGSLTCGQIFSRYAAIYCHKNKALQKTCCRSYSSNCLSPR